MSGVLPRATGRPKVKIGIGIRVVCSFKGQDVPVAACYLAYFGLAFFLVRWWKMADRRRRHRFSFGWCARPR